MEILKGYFLMQERSVKITFNLPIPSKKNSRKLCKNRRTGKIFSAPSDQYENWLQSIYLKMNNAKREIGGAPFTRCAITISVCDGSKRLYDLDNKATSILDALKHYGVIKDDNRFCVYALTIVNIDAGAEVNVSIAGE